MTEIVPTSLKPIIAKAASPAEVADAVGVGVDPIVPAAPEPPAVIAMTDDTRAALNALPGVFAAVQPAEVRLLTEGEIEMLYAETLVLKQIVSVLEEREEAVKEAVRNHMDLTAEAEGRAVPKDIVRGGHVVATATPRDRKGHYVTASKGNPERLTIPSTNQQWSREYREGRISFADATDDLLALYEAGEITREQYLAFTREVRAFDEAKAMDALRKDPETYVPILAKIAKRGAPGTALFIRKAKA